MTPRIIATLLICALLPAPSVKMGGSVIRPELVEGRTLRGLSAEESAITHSKLTAGLEEVPRGDLADDATGGAELSLAVAKAGGSALLVTDSTDPQLRKDYPVLVENVQTRNQNARETVGRIGRLNVPSFGSEGWSYFKIDSTLRGRWLEGIRARAKALQPDLIFLVPALISQGRGTRGGVHGLLQEKGVLIPLHETDYRSQIDPKLVESGSNLQDYLKRMGIKSVELLDQHTWPEYGSIKERLRSLPAGTYVVADAVQEYHLTDLARLIKELGRPVLCCGSAGLYEKLVSQGKPKSLAPWLEQFRGDRHGRDRVLVIAGSHHPVSQKQVRRALRRLTGQVELVTVKNMGDSLTRRSMKNEVSKLSGRIQEAWKQSPTVILQSSSPAVLHSDLLGRLLDTQGVRERLGLLVVFGGDTLDTVLRAFQGGFVATGEVAPQIPYGYLVRPENPAVPLVTKSGGFGSEGFLEDLLNQVRPIMPPRIGVTMGDPAGTGPELLLRALAQDPTLMEDAQLLVIGDAAVLKEAKSFFKIRSVVGRDLTLRSIQRPEEARFQPGVLNVLDLKNVDPSILERSFGPVAVGDLDEDTRRHFGRAALDYLDTGIELASAGVVDGLMTLPVTKEDVNLVDSTFRGHSERLGEKLGTLTGSGVVSIVLIHENLRVLHVTTHQSVREVVEAFQDPKITDRVFELIRVADLIGKKYFGLQRPRVGVLGFNPHAGEGGLLGREDQEKIQPAIDRALEAGLNVEPHPIPGDTAFTPGIRDRYDFMIAMYHDQGHAPFKALAGFEGINFTGNLSKVRTTPDHGTDRKSAYNLDRPVDPTSEGVIAALRSAVGMVLTERSSSGAGLEEGRKQIEEGWKAVVEGRLEEAKTTWQPLVQGSPRTREQLQKFLLKQASDPTFGQALRVIGEFLSDLHFSYSHGERIRTEWLSFLEQVSPLAPSAAGAGPVPSQPAPAPKRRRGSASKPNRQYLKTIRARTGHQTIADFEVFKLSFAEHNNELATPEARMAYLISEFPALQAGTPPRPNSMEGKKLRRKMEKALSDLFLESVWLDPEVRIHMVFSATGLEEEIQWEGTWSDIRWFWKLEPWQREQLLHGVPGKPGFFLNGWQHKESAAPGIAGMVRAWPRLTRKDPGAVWFHVQQDDFFRHLLDVEFTPEAAPWADRFREGVAFIRRRPAFADVRNSMLMAYLKFLSLADTTQPYLPEHAVSLREYAQAAAGSGKRSFPGSDFFLEFVLMKFSEVHGASLSSLGQDLRAFLTFGHLEIVLKAADMMGPVFTDEQGERFVGQWIAFLMRKDPGYETSVELMKGLPIWAGWGLSDRSREQVQKWLKEARLSELETFFLALAAFSAAQIQEAKHLEILSGINRALEDGNLHADEIRFLLKEILERRDVAERYLVMRLLAGVGLAAEQRRVVIRDLIEEWKRTEKPSLLSVARRWPAEVLDAGIVEGLAELLQRGRPRFREAAAVLLGGIDTPRRATLLVGALSDTEPAVCYAAMQVLSRSGDSKFALPEISKLHGNHDSRIRGLAARLLMRTGDPQWISNVAAVIREADPEMNEPTAQRIARWAFEWRDFDVAFLKAAWALRPAWRKSPPLLAKAQSLYRAVSLLPPVGGKIPLVEGRLVSAARAEAAILPPTWSVEEQIDRIDRMHSRGSLGKAYVHQLTVQGRLPDEFKYAAVALILNSPHPSDWKEPFFEAWWAKVAPLVHDGGNVETSLNPLWRDVQGRTDFLQRVVAVYEPELKKIERLPEGEFQNLLSADPELRRRYELEQMERDRLRIEGRAYQRLALALHAKLKTTPSEMPEEMRRRVADRWQNFQKKMESLLRENELEGLVAVPWFLDEPRKVRQDIEPRSEADWLPIQTQLLAMNDFLNGNPELADRIRRSVSALLKTIADDIDQDIGLGAPAAAGLEEKPPVGPGKFQFKVRYMIRPDYREDEWVGEVLRIERLNPRPQGSWDRSQFHQYAARDRAIVVEDKNENRIAGFLVFEKEGGGEDALIPEEPRVEILNLSVHPDYKNQGAEQEMVSWLREAFPEIPVVMVLHEEDRSSWRPPKELGWRTQLLKAQFDDGSDAFEFVLGPLEGVSMDPTEADEPVNQRLFQMLHRLKNGEISLQQATVEIFRVLEYVTQEKVPLTAWGAVSEVLAKAALQLNLLDAAGLLPIVEEASRKNPAPGSPLWKRFVDDLGTVIEEFKRESYLEERPSQYFYRRWFGSSSAGLEELPKELRNRLGEEAGTSPATSPVLLLGPDRIPMLSVAHRLALPGASVKGTPPLILAQQGLLPAEVLDELAKREWPVEMVPAAELTESGLAGRVKNALTEWERPVLVMVGSEYENAVRGLPGYDSRLTAVVLSPGFARHRALLSYLAQVLQLPGRFFRLEYVVETGFDEWVAVSTQL